MKTPSKPRPKPPVIGNEDLTASCGHPVKLEMFKHDKFVEVRRKNLKERPCPECRQKAHQETLAKQQAGVCKPKPWQQWQAAMMLSRLPDGARFDVGYNAEQTKWSGTLTIPGCPVFSGYHSAVFKLLHYLDTQYRKHAEENLTHNSPAMDH